MTKVLPAQGLEMTMGYLHLMAYCPADYIFYFNEASSSLREALAYQVGLSEAEYMKLVLPEACQRTVTFYQNKPKPDKKLVIELLEVALEADKSPEAAGRFSNQMMSLADMPKQVKPRQRHGLYNKEAFKINPAAMKYVLFAMVSKPNYELLKNMLAEETKKPTEEQDVVQTVWTFTLGHLWRTLGLKQAYVTADHLGNLAYCLLALSMYKSRNPFPEAAMETFYRANQAQIANWNHH